MGKALETNPYATLINAIFRSLSSVSGFNPAYVAELMDDDDLGLDAEDFYGGEFEYRLVYLAAAKTEVDEKFAPKFTRRDAVAGTRSSSSTRRRAASGW